MAKKRKPNPEQVVKLEEPVAVVTTPKSRSIYDFNVQAVILAALAFVFYFNSFFKVALIISDCCRDNFMPAINRVIALFNRLQNSCVIIIFHCSFFSIKY